MRTAFLCLAAAFIVAEAASVHAAPAAWPLPPYSYFLGRIPPPPVTGGFRDRADLRFSRHVQHAAFKSDVDQAERFVRFTVFTFADVLGPHFSAKNFPETAAFFKKLETTANGPKNFIKDHYARIRPYLAHPTSIQRLITPDDGFSYPSGHATRSWLYARVLAQLDPKDSRRFLEQAKAIGNSRVLGGMHYKSDIAASRTLADLIFQQLMTQSEFRADLHRLKKTEWTPGTFR
jgi:acid phosphatase (class A)